MKTLSFETKEEWLDARRGKITGSKLKDIVVKRGTGKKIGFYQLIADRLGIPADDENPMERGIRLESEALQTFAKETGKKIDTSLVIWTREDNEDIAYSPDAFTLHKKIPTECVETKCLASARHIEALLTQQIPDEYEFQKLQAFIVNDDLQTLYFVFYDPRLLARPFFYLTIKRSELQAEIDQYLAYERDVLAEIDKIVLELTF